MRLDRGCGDVFPLHLFDLSQSHPNNLKRLSPEKAQDEIERGFAAVALGAATGIAPFFRFPGLNDSDELLTYLQSRGIASFTVDVISNDSFIGSPSASPSGP